jgi:O-antigen/teichoic acid export membrane protein
VTTLAGWILWQAGGLLAAAMLSGAALSALGRPELRLMREEIGQGLYFSSATGARVLKQSGDIVVLGLVASPATIASFGLARRIVETSYLTVEALNRLAYPRLSKAMEEGISAGFGLSAKILVAAVAIALFTAAGIAVVAPLGPSLFGSDFTPLVPYLRAMAWLVVPVAIASCASAMLGASSNNAVRALLQYCTLLGVVFIGAMTYAFAAQGTIIALYAVEIALAAGFWLAVMHLARKGENRGPDRAGG